MLRLDGEDGSCSWGEAAPYPGLHRESLPETRRQLLTLCREVTGRELAAPAAGEFAELFPSVRFAWEMALFPFLNTDLPEQWQVPVSGLVNPAYGSPVAAARWVKQEAFRSVKVKVGRLQLREELEWLHTFLEELPLPISLHLDANRAWRLPEALQFLQNLPHQRIHYIEEPLKEFEELKKLAEKVEIPLALDESLVEHPPGSFPAQLAAFWIMKPDVLGSLAEVRRRCDLARENGVKVVFSNAFLSGAGLTFLALLQELWGNRQQPAGLGTVFWLEEDLLQTPIRYEGGNLLFRCRWPEIAVDPARLNPTGEAE
ncbi:MAG: o-succinylbenzoate synthase [Calditrichia bacterium]